MRGGETDKTGREETGQEDKGGGMEDDMNAPLQEGELLGGLDREGVKRAVHRLDTLPIEEFPLFMQSLPSDANAGNVPLEALQALLYEGTPEEQARNFKTQGNECYVLGQPGPLRDAIRFYSRGLETGCQDRKLLATLHLNRSAACLALGRTEDAFRDAQKAFSLLSLPSSSSPCSTPSLFPNKDEEGTKTERKMTEAGAAAIDKDVTSNDDRSECQNGNTSEEETAEEGIRMLRTKALQRILKTALSLERAEEARSAVTALEGAHGGGPVDQDLVERLERLEEKRAQERAAAVKEEDRLQSISRLVKGRGVTVTAGAEGQVLEHLGPDILTAVNHLPTVQSLRRRGPAGSRERLAWPVLLLYPEEAQTDWLQAVDEESRLQDVLETVLVPNPPWDNHQQYSPTTVNIYWHDAHHVEAGEGDRLVQLSPQVRLKDLIGTLVKTIDRGILSFFICPTEASDRLVNRYRRFHHWKG